VIQSGILVPTAEPSTFSISISQKNKSQNSSKRLSERLSEHDSGPTNRKAKKAIELRNKADNLAYQCEKQLKDLGDKLDEATKKSVEDAVAKVREALKGNDNDAVKNAFDDLQAKFQEVSSELYKKASAQAGPQRGPSEGPTAGAEGEKKDSDVVDAEFEMVDEDKKKN
jgi:molecular chaperone DnaK